MAKQPGAGFESHLLRCPRTSLVTPGLSSLAGSSCPSQAAVWTWFEHAECWGITMPLTRDSPSTQGDVPGPDPARAPPNKAIAQAGLACRGQPAGVCLASQGPRRGAPLPPRARRASAIGRPTPTRSRTICGTLAGRVAATSDAVLAGMRNPSTQVHGTGGRSGAIPMRFVRLHTCGHGRGGRGRVCRAGRGAR
jgi:hypothetical protein